MSPTRLSPRWRVAEMTAQAYTPSTMRSIVLRPLEISSAAPPCFPLIEHNQSRSHHSVVCATCSRVCARISVVRRPLQLSYGHTAAMQLATSRQQQIPSCMTCVADIDKWMSSNRLKLNADKTQFIWLGTHQQLQGEGYNHCAFKD